MTIFIKPNSTFDKTYFIVANFDEKLPCLESVFFADNDSQLVEYIKNLKLKDDDLIFYDGTVHYQTADELRHATNLGIFVYRVTSTQGNEMQSKKAAQNISAQAQWIEDNMTYRDTMKHDIHFQRFIQLLTNYKPTNPKCDPTAAELMADAAKRLRLVARINS